MSASTTSETTRCWPTTASPRPSRSLPSRSAAFWMVDDSVSIFLSSDSGLFHNETSPCGLEHRDDVAQLVRAARPGRIDGGPELAREHAGEFRERRDTVLGG